LIFFQNPYPPPKKISPDRGVGEDHSPIKLFN